MNQTLKIIGLWAIGIVVFFTLIDVIAGPEKIIRQDNSTYLSDSDHGYSFSCLMHKVTLDELSELASKKNIVVTQADVDEINQKPLCKDFCNQQLKYSAEYEDWFAEQDLRDTCASLGIILPK